MNKTIRNMQGRAGAARGADAGFTLIEMLIAVGALALIAAGVGAIFQATARTIQAGKRVSAFGQYVNLIKAQMRDDFALMTRDGFLVIRNEYADANGNGTVSVFGPGQPNADAVPLFDDDLRPRLRRTDEIMFFAKGQFVSARELLDPGSVARADAARIYYGHGQRAVPPVPPPPPGVPNLLDPYYTPEVDDQNLGNPQGAGRLGYYNSTASVPNPNQFASDWILARHVTLLRPSQTSAAVMPTPIPLALTPQRFTDSDIQTALQPAASSIFRVLAIQFPQTAPARVRDAFEGGFRRPEFSSGLVDIAATDLSLIRSIVMTCDRFPAGVNAGTFYNPLNNNGADGTNAGPDGQYRRFADDAQIVNRMQNWMDEGLPTWSMTNTNQKTRLRVERAPTNFVGVVSDATLTPVEKAARRADQIMLSSAGFLPRCTEFIVEWSFGKQYPSDSNDPNWVQGREGQYIWHGLARDVNGQTIADFYDGSNGFVAFSQSAPRVDPAQPPMTQFVPTQLIHAGTAANGAGGPLTSYFGYADPYFNPDSNNDGDLSDPTDARITALPWAWPRLVRVTLSLADPNDPSIEQSFQFVFEVPEAK